MGWDDEVRERASCEWDNSVGGRDSGGREGVKSSKQKPKNIMWVRRSTLKESRAKKVEVEGDRIKMVV